MNTTTYRRTQRQAGFTLVEILVTTAIIGILIGLILGVSGLAARKSDESKARAEMQKLSNAIEQYRVVYGSVPTYLKDLTNTNTKIEGEYKQLKLSDPWGRDFVYTNYSRYSYRLLSLGPKANDGTDDIESGTY